MNSSTAMMTTTKEQDRIRKHEEAAKKMFGKDSERQAQAYKKKGLSSTSRLIVERIKTLDGMDQGVHVDVGCGSGKICFELLKNGARRALGIDLSEDAIKNAQALADELGFSDRTDFIAGSFIDVDLQLNEDVQTVILHRVLCCHPNARGILEKTISLNPNHVFITVPTDNPIIRTIHLPIGVLTRLLTKGFQAQLHRHEFIISFLEARGYRLVFKEKKFPWITFHFVRIHGQKKEEKI